MLTVLDLFSGIGGISLGLESTGGFRTVMFCEIEPFPREVLRKHWPEVVIHDDVRTLSAFTLGGLRPDCIVGGFPCTDISVAGKGAGLHGPKSGLWFEYARIVAELRPRWVVAENVGALRTRGVDRVCSDLEGEGYSVWPLLVGAWAAGAPHKRERVWIVAHRHAALREQPGRWSGARGSGETFTRGNGAASGVGQADPDCSGSDRQRSGGVQHGERAASRHDADGRGERPVGEPTGSGLEGQRADSGEPQKPKPRNASSLSQPEGERRSQQGHGRDAGSWIGCDGSRWPARPGEPQWEWEEPRLAYAGRGGSNGRQISARPEQARQAIDRSGCAPLCVACDRWAGHGRLLCKECDPGRPELPLGSAVDGLPERLVRAAERRARRANREALKAYGNSVVPQVVHAIGQAILRVEAKGGA